MLLEHMMIGGGRSDAWLAQYSIASTPVQVQGMTIDTSGNIYVVGAENNVPLVMKLDRFANVTWLRKLSGLTAGIFNAVAVDGSGNVYCGGYNSPTGRMLIAKYDSTGAIQWKNVDGPATSPRSQVAKIHIGSNGTIYIFADTFDGSGIHTPIILGMNSSGVVSLRKSLANGGVDYTVFDGLYDGTNIVMIGARQYSVPYALFTAIDAAGSTIAFKLTDNDSSNSSVGYAIGRDTSGNFIIAGGQSDLSKFNSAGTLIWNKSYPAGSSGKLLAMDGDTPYFVSYAGGYVFSLTSAGALNSQFQVSGSGSNILAIAVDATYIYLAIQGVIVSSAEVITVLKLRKASIATGTFAGITIAAAANSLSAGGRTWANSSITMGADTNSSTAAGGADVAATSGISNYIGL